ncbi:Uncharacterised protein [Mycobacteroides abscessus subsp. abscessus]|nr:Uncharacterised protein [Mycobacteroides abscessus subsp. abscessus]
MTSGPGMRDLSSSISAGTSSTSVLLDIAYLARCSVSTTPSKVRR